MNNKTHNYFGAWDKDDKKFLICVHTFEEQNVWKDICEKYLDNTEYAEEFHKDPYEAMFHKDLKKYLEDVAPHILKKILYKYAALEGAKKGLNPLHDDNVEIRLVTKDDYGKFDSMFSFIQTYQNYMESQDIEQRLDFHILESAGFEKFDVEDVRFWKSTKESLIYGTLYIILDNSPTNSNAAFMVHIDDVDFCTIASVEIDYVWQFNLLMMTYGVDYLL